MSSAFKQLENTYNSEVIRVRTPNGTLFAFFLENADGTLNSIQLTIGKAGNDISPWAMAVAELMTKLIQTGSTLEDLIVLMSGLTSGREARAIGSTCRSGPEGVWQALMRYKRGKFEELNEKLGITDNDDYKGPSVAAWARTRER